MVNIVMMYVANDPNLDTVIEAMNGLLSIVFLADFTYRLFTADSKSGYFIRQFGWADLLASLPFPQVKILRVFRLVRVFRSPSRIRHHEHRSQPDRRPSRRTRCSRCC